MMRIGLLAAILFAVSIGPKLANEHRYAIDRDRLITDLLDVTAGQRIPSHPIIFGAGHSAVDTVQGSCRTRIIPLSASGADLRLAQNESAAIGEGNIVYYGKSYAALPRGKLFPALFGQRVARSFGFDTPRKALFYVAASPTCQPDQIPDLGEVELYLQD